MQSESIASSLPTSPVYSTTRSSISFQSQETEPVLDFPPELTPWNQAYRNLLQLRIIDEQGTLNPDYDIDFYPELDTDQFERLRKFIEERIFTFRFKPECRADCPQFEMSTTLKFYFAAWLNWL